MATEKTYPMTQAGKDKLEQELEYLKTVKRKEVVERIKVARSFGDLSENSEYDAAKDEQAFVEGRVTQIENMIRNAVIIEENVENSTTVSLGKSVTFVELPDGDEETYTIVGRQRQTHLKEKSPTTLRLQEACLASKSATK